MILVIAYIAFKSVILSHSIILDNVQSTLIIHNQTPEVFHSVRVLPTSYDSAWQGYSNEDVGPPPSYSGPRDWGDSLVEASFSTAESATVSFSGDWCLVDVKIDLDFGWFEVHRHDACAEPELEIFSAP